MAKYELVAGQHIEADKTKPLKGPDGKPTGRFEKKVFNAPAVVESDTNLVEKHGDKFRLLETSQADSRRIADLERQLAQAKAQLSSQRTPGDPSPENLTHSPAVAPGGQVSTGFQASVGGGRSGPMPPEQAEKALAAQGEATPKTSSYTRGELEDMHVQDLRELAESDEVDLKGATRKDEIIKRILGE